MVKNIIAAILIVSVFPGCLKNAKESFTCTYDPCALKVSDTEAQSVQDYLTANGITATKHCSGLFYVVDNAGSGATPTVCSNVTVTYEGKLTNGTVFDSSTSPVSFNLSQVITGWKNGLPLIKSGGRIYLYIPPSLAYGNNAVGNIPANSILIFRVDLIAVQ